MKLSDMIINQTVMIQIVWEEHTIEFTTNVIEKSDEGVIVAPYIHDGRPLKLDINYRSGVICNIFTNNPLDKARISWRNVDIASVDRGDELAYHIKTSGFNMNARNDDRRKHDRTVIQKKGQIYDREADKYIDILIHDISDIGISYYAPVSYVPQTNQLTVIFSDNVDDKFFDIKVDCKVSRTQIRAGNSFNGCKIVGENKDYLLYRFMKMLAERNRLNSDSATDGGIVEPKDVNENVNEESTVVEPDEGEKEQE